MNKWKEEKGERVGGETSNKYEALELMASFIKLLATFIYNNEHVRRIDANKAKWKIEVWNFCYSN